MVACCVHARVWYSISNVFSRESVIRGIYVWWCRLLRGVVGAGAIVLLIRDKSRVWGGWGKYERTTDMCAARAITIRCSELREKLQYVLLTND